MKTIIDNVRIFDDKGFSEGYVTVEDGMIVGIGSGRFGQKSIDVYDGQGCYLIPGLIDMHLHGAMGADFCDAKEAALDTICEYEARCGVTTLCAATMTLPHDELIDVLHTISQYKARKGFARIAGVNMEGPFISRERCGAQNSANIRACDYNAFMQYYEASGGMLKLVGVAPEASDSLDFIEKVSRCAHVAIAHSDADYDMAIRTFEAGADHVVHMFNGMRDMLHREPGIVGAVCDSEAVTAELICDGIHIHPAILRATFRLLERNRVIIVSDSMRAAGLDDGEYMLGGLRTEVKGREARLIDNGALAGSATNLADALRYLVNMVGIPLHTAVYCATINPAIKLGIYDTVGSIEVGKRADIVLWDENLNTRVVMASGNFVFRI